MNWDDDHVLERLRDWLTATRAKAATEEADEPTPSAGAAASAGDIGLYEFAAEFTALRQELKLQTKSTRGLQEQSEQALQTLQAATRQLQLAEQKARDLASGSAADNSKPFVEALINLDDALDRGRLVIEAAHVQITQTATNDFEQQLDEAFQRQSPWARWFGRGVLEAARAVYRQQVETGHGKLFESILAGYQVIQNRLQKVLKDHDIERILCLEQTVDPHCMTVVEARPGTRFPAGRVIEEVRRGYRWKGKVLRYAEVGVAAGDADLG